MERTFEIVRFYIHDLGRAVTFPKVPASLLSSEELKNRGRPGIRRDTPASLRLPAPLRLSMAEAELQAGPSFSVEARLYDDGALTVVVRENVKCAFEELESMVHRPVVSEGSRTLCVDEWAAVLFRRIHRSIAEAIVSPVAEENRDSETYTAFCLRDCPEGAAAFLRKNRQAAAALLIGEAPLSHLHEEQIEAALGRPFSYYADDAAVFDLDRCIIVDPSGDYEDVLLIAENASYRLLELRALDRLLDLRLDEAEKDLIGYGVTKRAGVLKGASPRTKFARIQALRFEALFILENLENSSKIIGDFYLCQIYDRLCVIFNTEEWKRSVERRLDILESVYDMAKIDSAERRTVMLEIAFIAVCVVIPAIQIWVAFLVD